MKRALLALLAFALVGCATQRLPADVGADIVALQAIPGFRLNGRIGVTAGSDGFNGALNWHQAGPDLDLSLQGPLGVGRVEIVGDDEQVVIRSKEGVQRFDDPEQALLSAYGWSVPVASLRFWILGAPRPGAEPASMVRQAGIPGGRIEQMSQDGWLIEYGEYRQVAGWVLPRKLTLTGGPLRVRLVVSRWQLEGADPGP